MEVMTRRALTVSLAALVWPFVFGATDKPFRKWTLDEAVEVLTNSPWARRETFTRVVGGIGSGVMGEKEIYSTFFVSSLP